MYGLYATSRALDWLIRICDTTYLLAKSIMESDSSDDEIDLAEAVLAANATAKRKRESLDAIHELKTIRDRIDWVRSHKLK